MAWVEVDITDIDIDTDKIAQEVIGGLDIKSEVEDLLRGGYGGIDLNDYIDGSDMRDTAREELYECFDDALEDNDEFKELRHTVRRLVEHLALPEERTGEEQIQYLIESDEITLARLETIVTNQCDEWRRNMKIAQIHEVVGL
jgi:hypothetical protein